LFAGDLKGIFYYWIHTILESDYED
jgi:hypothetical protein